MSTCPNKDLYSAFVDGEVPSPWKEKLESHLEICAECRKTAESYKSLKEKIKNSTTPEINLEDSFARFESRKLSKAIREEGKEKKPNWFTSSIKIPIPAFAAAALFLFVFMPVLIINTKKPEVRNEIVIANFKPIMPVSQALSDKNSTEFNFHELTGLSLNVVRDIKQKRKSRLNFAQFINLYLPSKNTKQDIHLINNFDKTAFSQTNFQNFNLSYNKNE